MSRDTVESQTPFVLECCKIDIGMGEKTDSEHRSEVEERLGKWRRMGLLW